VTGTDGSSPRRDADLGDDATAAAWARRRADRERELGTPHGWLSLTAYHWLPSRPTHLPGVPGLWWADESGAHLRPGGGGDLLLQGPDLHDGTYDGDVLEGGSVILGTFLPLTRGPATPERSEHAETARVAVELVRRTGRLAIRLRDPHARARLDFAGVPAFDHDPSWDVEVPVRLYADPFELVVGAARPGLVHRVRAVGEIDLTHGDRTVTLTLTGGPGGAPTLLFSDEAAEVAPWRVVRPELPVGLVPGATGTARLDLNGAVNLPFAFSGHGTCPAPPAGNHAPFAVTAGERALPPSPTTPSHHGDRS
jgi:uncharacterized protein